MKESIYHLLLDVHGHGLQLSLPVKRGDSARCLRIRLTESGRSYPIGADCSAVFTAKKPDETVIYNACTIEKNEAVYSLTGQETNTAGVVLCELRLYDGGGELLTSPSFCLLVEDTVYGDNAVIDSSSEYTALTALVSQTKEALEEVKALQRHSVLAYAPLGTAYTGQAPALDLQEGTEILLLPQSVNQGAATLALNGGTAYPLCLRPGWNVTGDDLHPQLTLPLESGMLLRGGEYIFRFDGAAWVLQSYVVQPGVYVQDEEPAWTEDGSVWIDTDEEPEEADTVTAEELEEALSIAAQEQKAYVDEAIAQAGGSGGAAATDITDQVMEWTLGLDENLSGALAMFYIAALVQMQYGPGRYIAFGGTAQFDVYYSEDLLQGQIRAQVQSSSVELSFATGSDEEVRHNGYVFYVDPYTNKREMLNIVDGQFVGFRVTGLAEPTEDSGAANKKYVDDAIAAALAAMPITEEGAY